MGNKIEINITKANVTIIPFAAPEIPPKNLFIPLKTDLLNIFPINLAISFTANKSTTISINATASLIAEVTTGFTTFSHTATAVCSKLSLVFLEYSIISR